MTPWAGSVAGRFAAGGVRNLKNLVIEKQQSFRILIVQVSSSEKVRADHLQAVAARFVGVWHEGRRFDRRLDNGISLLYNLK